MKNLHQIREVSVLSFNERVLQEAEDPRNPLMERLKFLGIFSSNMDEFFKVRVASIQRRVELGKKELLDLLEVVGDESRGLDERFQSAYARICEGLAQEGIRILTERDVERHSPELIPWLHAYFHEEVLPHLVPIILLPGRPFPPLKDGALYFGIKMWGRHARFAILELPAMLPRFVKLPNNDIMYVDDVIRHQLNEIFYIFKYERIEAFEFKISRDAELDIDNDFSEGYIRKMRKVLEQRKGGRPTRLVYDAVMPSGLLRAIVQGMGLDTEDTMIGGGRYHNMKDLMGFPMYRPDLSFEEVDPALHPVLDMGRTPMLQLMRREDILITYPYQSFDHVVRLLREAAIDPKVEEIKMTLYRTTKTSQIVNALGNAARNGKKVAVSIELMARFDEENNITMSERLLETGAQVMFGVPPMKTHCKLLLIKRGEKFFAGLSTGNFNEKTGKLYVDSMLLTSDPRLTSEVARVFRIFDKNKIPVAPNVPIFEHLLVSPFNTRDRILQHIDEELRKGAEGYIFIKTNHLTDVRLAKKLYAAAEAGVRVDLVVRTTYAVPSHPNIRAISILDRYLEHQRIYLFGHGKDMRLYMSSADMMERNLDYRVEVGFPVYDNDLKREVAATMAFQIQDNVKARVLDQMQTNPYVPHEGEECRTQYATQAYFNELAAEALARPPAQQYEATE